MPTDLTLLEACLANPGSLVELGVGDGSRARWLHERFPSLTYRGFDLRTAAATLAHGVTLHDPAFPLPLDAGSADAFVCFDVLSRVRTDQLYMVLAEARRVLRPGGVCVLRSLGFSPTLAGRVAARAWLRIHRERALDLNHYLSPEDWLVRRVEQGRAWLRPQILVLERAG